MKELGRSNQINIHNTRSLILTLKYVSEETCAVEEYKQTHKLGQQEVTQFVIDRTPWEEVTQVVKISYSS